MLRLLLVFLFINEASAQAATTASPYVACTNGDPTNDIIRETALKVHNDLRLALIENKVDQDSGDKFPGSKSMFKMTYDCALEGLAMTTLSDCSSKPKVDYLPPTMSLNYARTRAETLPPDPDIADMIKDAAGEWADTRYDVTEIDEKTLVYENTDMEPFANMIYTNTTTVGCGTMFCSKKKRLAIACLYDSKPMVGEPLYKPAKTKTGCNDENGPCNKALKGAKCLVYKSSRFFLKKKTLCHLNPHSQPIRRQIRHA
ncbi:hypothetical protein Y032_0010g1022 [Ancylostoma ceylanicum]|uniref:SCP domain-containing protein n=1 Tax=Ancylostoma ceylanicum TaxID=53326 RepID=A0A016VHG6_9BILA|nr:hypothetical protein Y032_0010g1022 [Ancylostoma ceylanicum]